MHKLNLCRAALALVTLILSRGATAEEPSDYFETRIRSVLVEHCYSCHNSRGKADGGLKVDYRDGLRQGGDSGPAIVPGAPEKSLLLQAVRHDSPDLKMPQAGVKLSPRVVADIERWIQQGAFDPRVEPPSAAEIAELTSWESQLAARKKWWCFQPLLRTVPPTVVDAAWSYTPIDRYIRAQLDREQIEPAGLAERRVLLRRVSYALTGLAPSAEEASAFLNDDSPLAYERLVDRLLASPRFGERFARHWMDWVRYAESHGSEGDPIIPQAASYRDYMIRALNADVPYDQLVREHLAGDQLESPRMNDSLGINESAIGMAHLRMVQHGYAPVDPLDDQVRFVENQIDVISKAFLGLTVACARCHDHKFDAISQADFYSLYGMLASCRPALVTVDTPARQVAGVDELTALKQRLKKQLAEQWQQETRSLSQRLLTGEWALPRELLQAALVQPGHALHAWCRADKLSDREVSDEWQRLRRAADDRHRRVEQYSKAKHQQRWHFATDDSNVNSRAWNASGTGLNRPISRAGEFHVLPTGEQIVANIYPAGVYTHRLSSKQNGVFTSPSFPFEGDELWLRVSGGNGARARFVVENYPRVIGLLYKGEPLKSEEFSWVKWDLRFFSGDSVHVELATAGDLPVEAVNQERSWFGITAAVVRKRDEPEPIDEGCSLASLRQNDECRSRAELADVYSATLRECVEAWRHDRLDDRQAEFLGSCVRHGLLSNSLSACRSVRPLVEQYREVEAQIIRPTRVPGVLDTAPLEQPLMVRGDHKQLAAPVKHRALEAFGGRPYDAQHSRMELARDLTDPANPLIARVIVNRLWHHIFGRGLVATPDNLGRLGESPTHPELLDYLAADLMRHDWSLKHIVRSLVLSRTFRSSSQADAARDPLNRWVGRAAVRRLEAEAIRDTLLQVGDTFDLTMFGASDPHVARRRSVYMQVRRNRLDPFLSVFDCPEPYTTRGVRDTTNVPAQSLALLNDRFVLEQAVLLAGPVIATGESNPVDRMNRLYQAALGRFPDESERAECFKFFAALKQSAQDAEMTVMNHRVHSESLRRQILELLQSHEKQFAPGASAGTSGAEATTTDSPRPFALWEFDDDDKDSLGKLLSDSSWIESERGALILNDRSDAVTRPLPIDLHAKTLQAWVELDTLQQRGGGVMSVETIGGGEFDAIVFAEQAPLEWLAGSNHFKRTKPFQGVPERDADQRSVCVTIVYEANGKVTGYRDGRPYGNSYQTEAAVHFRAQQSRVLFGVRHSPPGGNRNLRGRIHRAALYDRALMPDEVKVSSVHSPANSSTAEIVNRLPPDARREHERLSQERRAVNEQLSRVQILTSYNAEFSDRMWIDLALALLNLKEFIYLE